MAVDQLQALQEERMGLANQIHALAELPELNAEQRETWDKVNARYDANTVERAEIDDLKERVAADANARRGNGSSSGKGMLFRTDSGHEVRSYTADEQIATRESADVDVGRCLRGMLLNDPGQLTSYEERTLLGGSDSAGGFLLPKPVGVRVVDLARASSVAVRAGAQTIAMDDSSLKIARVTADPTAYWRPELAAVTSSTVTFDAITLRPKTVAVIVPISIELAEDADNISALLSQVLSNALGAELDRVIFSGTGASSEPLGIRNDSNVPQLTGVGVPIYSDVTSAVGDILTANYSGGIENLSWIANPRTFESFAGLLDSTTQPLRPPVWAEPLKQFSTTSISVTEGGGSNESFMVIGDMSQIVVGLRTNIEIRVASDGQVTDADSVSYNATTQLLRHVIARMRVDVGILRPTHFITSTGITA